MALTSEQMEQITVDLLNGSPPRVTGKEADEFRAAVQKDIDLAKKNGWVIEIPTEMQAE